MRNAFVATFGALAVACSSSSSTTPILGGADASSGLDARANVDGSQGAIDASMSATDSGGAIDAGNGIAFGPCPANALWVATSGGDSNAGTQATPWKTLQHAANSVKAGDTVCVADGSYAGFFMDSMPSGTAASRITFRAQNPCDLSNTARPTCSAKITGVTAAMSINGTTQDLEADIYLRSVSYVAVFGFEVTGAPEAGIAVRSFAGVNSDTTNDVVQGNWSHDNGGGQAMGRHDGIFTAHATNVVIRGNVSSHNGEHGVYVSNSADGAQIIGNTSYANATCGLQINADGTSCDTPIVADCDGVISNWLMDSNVVYGNSIGINLDGAVMGRAQNNYVYGNSGKGIAMYSLDALEASHDNVVVNNTVISMTGPALELVNNGDGSMSNIGWSPNNNVIFNNILYATGNNGLSIDQAITGTKHDDNLISSIEDDADNAGLSAHESSPALSSVLTSMTPSGYMFPANSPAVGKGVASYASDSAPTVDLTGASRGGAIDLGAYQ